MKVEWPPVQEAAEELLPYTNLLTLHGFTQEGLYTQPDLAHPHATYMQDPSLHNSAQCSSPPGNVGVHKLQHVQRGLVESDKHAVVDLPQSKKVKYLSGPGMNTIDTKGTRGRKEEMRGWGNK